MNQPVPQVHRPIYYMYNYFYEAVFPASGHSHLILCCHCERHSLVCQQCMTDRDIRPETRDYNKGG